MDAVLKVIGIVGVAWMLLSILAGLAWALGGKRILRKPPIPTGIKDGDLIVTDINGVRNHRRAGER